MDIAKRHNKLCGLIRGYDKQYYVYNKNVVDDSVYDSLRRELVDIEKNHPELVTPASPTQVVGYELANHFRKLKHDFPMLSLDNVFDAQELVRWIKGLPTSAAVVAEAKADGISLDLIYIRGWLEFAITRGDGITGEDVTLNAKQIRSIPHKLRFDEGEQVPERIVVRGEVVAYDDEFKHINAKLQAQGQQGFPNTRNFASGSLRRKDYWVTGERMLDFLAYSLDCSERMYTTVMDAREALTQLGFTLVQYLGMFECRMTELGAWEELLEEFYIKVREEGRYPYAIDGVVFKVLNFSDQYELGHTSRAPRFATSYKFPASTGASKLLEIIWQIGRTGKLTPVAKINPVFVHGTTITSVTLHNPDEIKRLGLMEGDTVIVKRAGDVIPKITEPMLEWRSTDAKPIEIPTECPCCKTQLKIVAGKEGNELFCPNDTCSDRVVAHLYYCADRDMYNIQGLGIENIMLLHKHSGFTQMQDHMRLMFLTDRDLRVFESSDLIIRKILDESHKARHITLERLIASFGIQDVARGTAAKLAAHFGSIEAIAKATKEEFMQVEGIGKITAPALVKWFADDNAKPDAESWYKPYLDRLMIEAPPPTTKELDGFSVVVSGSKFDNRNRKEIEQHIKSMGGKVAKDVSSNTTFCLFGTKATSRKILEAKEQNVPYIIYYEDGTEELSDGNREENYMRHVRITL